MNRLAAKLKGLSSGKERRRFSGGTLVFALLGPVFSQLALVHALAQDSLLLSQNNQRDANNRTQNLETLPYTMRWGDLKLLAGASMAGEWNDNINLSQVAPESDFILHPKADCSLYWPVTDINVLNVSIGIGYDKYLSHSENDHVNVSPGSQLNWDVTIQQFKINLHDLFSYYEDPTIYGSVSGVTRFGGFENTAGVLGTWDLYDVVLSLGYDHYNFISSTTAYSYTTHASDFVTGRVAARVHPGVLVGVETSAGPTEYDEAVLQNNTTFSLGAFAEWQVTDFIKTEIHSGYLVYNFDKLDPIPAATETGYYLSMECNQRIREHLSCALEAGHETSLGIYSSLTEEWYGQGGIDWQPLGHLSAHADLRYEMVTQPIYLQGNDNYDRVGVNFLVADRLNKKWTASVAYRYWIKSADTVTYEDYEQNQVTLQIAYQF